MSILYHIIFRLAFTADPFEVRTACVTAEVAKIGPSILIPFVRSSLVATRRSSANLSHITFHLQPAELLRVSSRVGSYNARNRLSAVVSWVHNRLWPHWCTLQESEKDELNPKFA